MLGTVLSYDVADTNCDSRQPYIQSTLLTWPASLLFITCTDHPQSTYLWMLPLTLKCGFCDGTYINELIGFSKKCVQTYFRLGAGIIIGSPTL